MKEEDQTRVCNGQITNKGNVIQCHIYLENDLDIHNSNNDNNWEYKIKTMCMSRWVL